MQADETTDYYELVQQHPEAPAVHEPPDLHVSQSWVIDRNGAPPPAHETGWKDTVSVAPGEDVQVIARFKGYRGRYLIHCHNLEHEDHHMMARYDVM